MHANAHLEKVVVTFWDMKKHVICCRYGKIHYRSLLTSVESTQHKASVNLESTNILNISKITFTPLGLSNAFKSLKRGQTRVVDDMSVTVSCTFFVST